MLDRCRICLLDVDQSNAVSVYFRMFEQKSILEVMQECFSIEIFEVDNLPKFICPKCIEKLDSFYEFRKLIINSDVQLKTQFRLKKENSQPDEETENYPNECYAWNFVRTETKEETESFNKNDIENPLDENVTPKQESDPFENVENSTEGPIQEATTNKCKKIKKPRKPKLYECKECNRTFKSPHSFKNHNIKHTGVKPFSCEYCDKGFVKKSVLIVHRRVHTGDRPFTCDICHKTFGSPSGLWIHKRYHIGEKKFFCEICNKGFYQSSEVRTHMRSHTGEKPYMCDVCSKTFKDHINLVRHMERHQETEKTPCPICGSLYKLQRDLQRHIKKHESQQQFVCSECGQTFTAQASLNRHKQRICKKTAKL